MNAIDPEKEKGRSSKRPPNSKQVTETLSKNAADAKILICLLALKIQHDTKRALGDLK